MPNRLQAITWTNDILVPWHHMASLGHQKFNTMTSDGNYRQVSNISCTKSQNFSYRLAAIFAESLEARC